MDPKLWISLALAALVAGEGRSQPLEMQVEEPAVAAPPVDPEKDAGRWKDAPAKPSLSKAQKKAYVERRKQVEAMASEVRAKREALINSSETDRAARAKELEDLILDPALDAGKLEKLEKRLEKQSEAKAKAKALEQKLEKQENKAEKAKEKQQEKLEKEKTGQDK